MLVFGGVSPIYMFGSSLMEVWGWLVGGIPLKKAASTGGSRYLQHPRCAAQDASQRVQGKTQRAGRKELRLKRVIWNWMIWGSLHDPIPNHPFQLQFLKTISEVGLESDVKRIIRMVATLFIVSECIKTANSMSYVFVIRL